MHTETNATSNTAGASIGRNESKCSGSSHEEQLKHTLKKTRCDLQFVCTKTSLKMKSSVEATITPKLTEKAQKS